MTITITTGNDSVTDFLAYLDTFDAAFTPAGRGTFSDGLQGDYAGAESDITDTANPASQAYILRGEIVYSMTTHTLSGPVSGVDLGYGATLSNGVLALDQSDYSVSFDPEISNEDDAHDMIYGFFGMSDDGSDRSDFLASYVKTDSIDFTGANGDDSFKGYRFDDVLIGKRGDDMLKGGAGDDVLKGGRNSDTLKGNKGDDTLDGGNGHDTLIGGKGADTLIGGKGKDVLTGGKGRDTFVFEDNIGKDKITDFTPGRDSLDFSNFDGEATSYDEFLSAAVERGNKVVYDFGDDGDNLIVLLDTSLDDLSASDFIF